MNSAEYIRRTKVLGDKRKNTVIFALEGLMKYDRKKIKNAWNTGNHKSVVIHSNGRIFSTCLPGL